AAAARLASAGCDVHVLDVRPPADGNLKFVACDVGRADAIDVAVRSLPSRIDALVHVAGIASAEPPEAVVAVNFLGLRHLTTALLPRIADGGAVVIVASSAARDWQLRAADVEALLATPDHAAGLAWLAAHRKAWATNPYKFSKQCAAAWTYRAAGLGQTRGIRVNCINPGTTETRLSPEFRQLVGVDLYEWGLRQVGRAGRPEDFAPVIEFLALGDCPWLNGVELLVDGGYVAGLVGGWVNAADAPAAIGAPVVSRFAAALRRPDLTERPHRCTVERWTKVSPSLLYRGWTEQLGRWLAAPGSVCVTPQVNVPWFFETEFSAGPGRLVQRHAHYGRFLNLVPDRLVETTWVTGAGGTEGAETLVTVEFVAQAGGTRVQLTQAGFDDAAAAERHALAWPAALELLFERLAGG
ncbi:MAG: SDR family oxidoreductase, partial [Pseudomonadales bacterium]